MAEISIFDMFSVGIGPSSSHTVGPMRAAKDFVERLEAASLLQKVDKIEIHLYGSLALTGFGHGTPNAILGGLEGEAPETVDPVVLPQLKECILETKQINLLRRHQIQFDFTKELFLHPDIFLEKHSNAVEFKVYNKREIINAQIYYSIGGGFILREGDEETEKQEEMTAFDLPYPFQSANNLLSICENRDKTIAEICMANENMWRPEAVTRADLLKIVLYMRASIERGCLSKDEYLPGGLNVRRRAPELYEKLMKRGKPTSVKYSETMAWLNLYALAVGEENAAGGRIITAPTNGAAGVIPAVLQYYCDFYEDATEDRIVDFLLTAGTVGLLFKKGASIAGAEVGCQGEIGVASSMAAAGFAAALGSTPKQIENAAEIAMEHHLGMTCDPIGGLVQIPCIERNAMGAVKAVNAAHLARIGSGEHYVSLDKVRAVMLRTGHDMSEKYKETSLGGLAQNIVGC